MSFFRKLFKKGNKEEENEENEDTKEIGEEPEPKTTKVKLIRDIMYYHYKGNNNITCENQLSLVEENKYSDFMLKIILYDENKKKNKLDDIIISKNSILISTKSEPPNKIDILNFKKTFTLQTNSIEEGFIYNYIENNLIISFFSNLFEKYLGIELKINNNDYEKCIIEDKTKIYLNLENQKERDKYKGYPVYYIKDHLLYLNEFINFEGKFDYLRNNINSYLKMIYVNSLIIDEQYKNLNVINLSNSRCGSKGIEILIKICFPNLNILKLNNIGIKSDAIKLLKDKMFLNLSELDLSRNNLEDVAIEYLDKLNLINLKKLNISDNNITNNSLKIFESKNFINLIELNLSYNRKIDDKGIKYMKNSQLINLKTLNLEYVFLDYEGLYLLSNLPFSNNIENLYLYLTKKIKYEDIPSINKNLESNCKNLKNFTYIRENMKDLKFNFLLVGYSDISEKIYQYLSGNRENYLNTLGIDYKTKTVISELKIKVEITFWITSGIERFRYLPKSYYKKADGIVFSFGMNNESSFDFVTSNARNIEIPYVYLSKNEEQSIITEANLKKVLDVGGKIFYFDEDNKKGIDDGIGWLADKFTK